MARSVLVDTGFLVSLLSRRDANHSWAAAQAPRFPPPWKTCEAVLSETFHLLGAHGTFAIAAMLHRQAVVSAFHLDEELEEVLELLKKYADLPMSLADACLVRMTEVSADPVLLTTDADFRVYRRHSRRSIPTVAPD